MNQYNTLPRDIKTKLIRIIISITAIIIFNTGFSQTKKILVYHETNGYRHSSIVEGIQMFIDLGNENNDWTVDSSEDSSVFSESNLGQYDAVVFLSTSGTGLLTISEREAFENFIASGKGFIGIHAATDTYRDKTWPFYNELVGAIVQTSPNHTSNNFNANIQVKQNHFITDFIGTVGSIWNKNEEYYYWEQNGGQLSADNTVLLEVESTGSNSYDAARPITWYKESITYDDDNDSNTPNVTLSGIRSFYTALGHNGTDFDYDSNFRTMLKNATLWAIGNSLSIGEQKERSFIKISNNPIKDKVELYFNDGVSEIALKVYDVQGEKILEKNINASNLNNNLYELNCSSFKSGLYFINVIAPTVTQSFKVVKNQ